VKVESIKAPKTSTDKASADKAPTDSGTLHKKMMQLLSSLWVTHAIGTFARLGLADAVDGGADTAAAIAAPRGLVVDRVYRLLRALSTCGIVTESAGGRFALTPLGRLLTSDSPHSMRTSASLLTDYHADIWGNLDGALKGGVAFETLNGQPLFAWLAAHPQEGARFQRMMVEVHSPETPAIVAAYDFSRFKTIVDVGGGHGMLLSAILAAYPNVRGTLFDLQEGVDAARRGCRRLSVPASAARLRRRRLPADARQRSPRHEAGLSCAGAGENGADRRHAGPRPLARPACHAADGRPRTHGARIRDAVCQGRLAAQSRAADRASGGRDHRGRCRRRAAIVSGRP
jgi:hypothetical protein